MKLVFLSNFLNHHQLPFCQEMYARFGKDFIFVQTEPVNEERLNMGYAEMSGKYPYLLCPYLGEHEKKKVSKAVAEADFVMIGSAPESYIKQRLEQNLPILRFSERFLRHELWRFLTPKSIRSMYRQHVQYKKNDIFVLCASVYTARDYALYGVYKNKTYKWGYFPEFIDYDLDELMKKKRGDKVELLWVARFLKLKHPEKFLHCCNRLKLDGIPFHANIVGSGECEQEMREYVASHGLEDSVDFLGTMSPEQVRETMARANIFMFNSDFREGWGAVINEAMNSGCAVISSHAPGAPGFMFRHGVNGLVYRDKSDQDLYKQLKRVAADKDACEQMGRNAFLTMKTTWNAAHAAESLVKLMEALKAGHAPDIQSGPCSKAYPIPQRKVYRAIIRGKIK